MKNINNYVEELIDKGLFNLEKPFSNLELLKEQEEYLQFNEDRRIEFLKKRFEKTKLIKKCMENPKLARSFHQFFQYFVEWYNLDKEEIGKMLGLKSKQLQFFNNIRNKITDFPLDDLIKLVKYMQVSLDDAITLLSGSFKLTKLDPNYGATLARFHENDSVDKNTSMKNALNELLLKSSQVKKIQTDELDAYLENFKSRINAE